MDSMRQIKYLSFYFLFMIKSFGRWTFVATLLYIDVVVCVYEIDWASLLVFHMSYQIA